MKTVLGLGLWCVVFNWMCFGQGAFKGTLSLDGNSALEGTFNKMVDKRTTTLSFIDTSGKTYNVLSYNGALVFYNDTKTHYTSYVVEKNAEMLEVVVLGDARLYKSLKTQKVYTENVKLDTGITELTNISSIDTNKANRGKLLVVFKDCKSVRERTYSSDMRFNSVKQLVEAYNNCGDINADYQFTSAEKRAQEYAYQKTIITYDIGVGYYSTNSDIGVFTEATDYFDSASNGGVSLFASMNISPNYFYGLTGKLFTDISLQYNFASDLKFDEVRQNVSNLNLMFTPKFYFGETSSNFRPFVGFGVGLGILFTDIEDTVSDRFPNSSETAFKFIYSPQFGILLFNNMEVSADFFPYYSNDLFFNKDEVKVESNFKSFTIKLGYNF